MRPAPAVRPFSARRAIGLIEINARSCHTVMHWVSNWEADMPAEVQISFRGMEASPSVEAQVRRRAEELQQFSDRVSACRVTLERRIAGIIRVRSIA